MNWIIKSAITIKILKQLIAVIIVSKDYSQLNLSVINKERKREKKEREKSNSRTARPQIFLSWFTEIKFSRELLSAEWSWNSAGPAFGVIYWTISSAVSFYRWRATRAVAHGVINSFSIAMLARIIPGEKVFITPLKINVRKISSCISRSLFIFMQLL